MILHMIEAMHIKWPSKCTLIIKTDLDAAYRCVHANAKIASTWIIIVGKLAFLCLSLTFSTTPAPEEYTTISEVSINIENDILTDAYWDATNLQSPHRNLLSGEDYPPALYTLVKAYQMEVNIEAKESPIYEFINDIITITIDDSCWVEHFKNAALLVIHTIFRPLHPYEPLKWDQPLSLRKLSG